MIGATLQPNPLIATVAPTSVHLSSWETGCRSETLDNVVEGGGEGEGNAPWRRIRVT